MADAIAELQAEVDALRQEASYATSGGEGMAAMGAVRRAQVRLAAAYVASADAATDDAVQRTHLERARAALLDVLASAHGPDHEAQLPLLESVLTRVGEPAHAHHAAIAEAWLAEADRASRSGRPSEGQRVARRARSLLDG